jgi:uncharacterized protein involved in exopolysaccharide biosynthesis
METPSPYYDDEIDLRELALALWRERWLILAVTLIAALAAFIVSAWILPKKYQAAAYVTVRAPIMGFANDQGLVTTPVLPDLTALKELATTPGLLAGVVADPALVPAGGAAPLSAGDLNSMAQVSVVGKDQLRLQVTDTDPQRAAQLANLWAKQAAVKINTTYGVTAVVQSLDGQLTSSRQAYNQAQAALEKELSSSQVDALEAQLQDEKDNLSCLLAENSARTRVLADLGVLGQRLEALPGDSALSVGDALALTTLQQRALASQTCAADVPNLQLQLSSSAFSGLTAADALGSIAQIQAALNSQQSALLVRQNDLQQSISLLESQLEAAQNRLAQFKSQRDQAQSLYEALAQQQKQLGAVRSEGNQLATLSIEAVPPEKKASPKVLINTALAGLFGLVLAVLWVFVVGWWRSDGK